MELNDLKGRLEISSDDTSRDTFLQYALEDAIEFLQAECKQTFVDEIGVMRLPGGVKRAVVKLVKLAQQKPNIQSRSISGGMSESYFSSSDKEVIKADIRPYIKAVFH